MGDLWLQLLPIAVAMAITPGRILAVILLFHTPKATLTALGDTRTADAYLPNRARRHRTHGFVEQVYPAARGGPPYGHGATGLYVRDLANRAPYGALRGTVFVVKRRPAGKSAMLHRQVAVARLTGDDDAPQAVQLAALRKRQHGSVNIMEHFT